MRVLPLLAIVALGVQLRLTFYQGVIHTDDLVYSQLAWRLAEGVSPFAEPLPPTFAAARIGLYGPVALAYWLFGASDATTLWWPFVCSILAILGAYGIGRLVHAETSGLLAAFLIAVLPTNVAAATALLGDGPIAAMSIGTVFFLLLSNRTTGWRSLASMAGSLVCFGVGMLNKPLILLTLPFLAVYFMRRMPRSRLTVAGLAVVVVGAAASYVLYFGLSAPVTRPDLTQTLERLALTSTDLWQQMVNGQREFLWIAPLWIVSLVALLAWRTTDARSVLLWLGLTFLFGELGTRTLTSYTPIVWYDAATSARHFLLIAAPAMILTGIYLAQGISVGVARWLTTIAVVVTGMAAWIGSRGALTVTWGVTGQPPAELPFAVLSAVATIVVIFGGIVSPAILKASSTTVRVVGTAAIVLSVGLASLNHSYRAATEFRNPWVETLPAAMEVMASQPAVPIIVQNDLDGMRLDYLSGFRFGYQSSLRPPVENPRIRVAPDDPTSLSGSYVLVDEHNLAIATPTFKVDGPAYLRNPPARWALAADVGQYSNAHVKVYRVSSGDAAADLVVARAAIASMRTDAALRTWMGAAAAAGAYCEAVTAWHEWRAIVPPATADAFNAVPILTECLTADPSLLEANKFRNADFSEGLKGWLQHPESNVTIQIETESDGVPVWHAVLRSGNWAPISQEQQLKPDTPYVFEAVIRTTVPVVALYWQQEEGHFFQNGSYKNWTPLRYVFVTPRWPQELRTIGLHPVLMPIAGEAWVKNLRLSELRRPPS